MNSGHLGLCRLCIQNDLIEEQNTLLRNRSDDSNDSDFHFYVNVVIPTIFKLATLAVICYFALGFSAG